MRCAITSFPNEWLKAAKFLPTVLAMLMLQLPGRVKAQGQFEYAVNADDTVTITGYTGPPWAISIPTNIDGLMVTGIGATAFEESSLVGVAIPCTVTNIGEDAFVDSFSLTNVTFSGGGSSPIEIGMYAFGLCTSLGSVTFPSNAVIGDFAFLNCSGLGNITFVNGESMGEYTFAECFALTNIYLWGEATGQSNSFNEDSSAVVYYSPEANEPEFSIETGVPGAAWSAQIQTAAGNFGVKNNVFGFNVVSTNSIPMPIVIQVCTNLNSAVWAPLQSVTLTNGSFFFTDAEWTNYLERFYRVSAP
jgi:hypothetical protein